MIFGFAVQVILSARATVEPVVVGPGPAGGDILANEPDHAADRASLRPASQPNQPPERP
jgi:hypothetical protein